MALYEERLSKDLARIRADVATLGAGVEKAMRDAVAASLAGDRRLANETVIRDHPINRTMLSFTRGPPSASSFTVMPGTSGHQASDSVAP